MTIPEAWLDMYHRARSVGVTHATAMKILVDPEDLSEREAVIAQLSKQPAFHSVPLVEFTKEALLWMETFPGMIPTFRLSLDEARKMVSFEKKATLTPEPIINRIIDARAKVEATGKAPGYIILGQIEFDRLNEEVKELDYRFYSMNTEGFMIDGLRIVVDPVHESRIDVAVLRPKAK